MEKDCGNSNLHNPHHYGDPERGYESTYCPGYFGKATEASAQDERELARWWRDTAEAEAEMVYDKATRYGANSMLFMGHGIAAAMRLELSGVDEDEMSDGRAFEIACLAYVLGKVGRWIDAVAAGDEVGTDTLTDLSVYPKMVQRYREAGGWPGSTGQKPGPDLSRRETSAVAERPCGRTDAHGPHKWSRLPSRNEPVYYCPGRISESTECPCGNRLEHGPHVWGDPTDRQYDCAGVRPGLAQT